MAQKPKITPDLGSSPILQLTPNASRQIKQQIAVKQSLSVVEKKNNTKELPHNAFLLDCHGEIMQDLTFWPSVFEMLLNSLLFAHIHTENFTFRLIYIVRLIKRFIFIRTPQENCNRP